MPVSNSTEDTPLPGVCLECHEDSPVVSSPHPKLLLVQIMMDCDCFENVVQVWTLCTDAVEMCMCLAGGEKATFCMQHERIICPSLTGMSTFH